MSTEPLGAPVDVLAHVLAYINAGLRVFPVRADKSPYTADGFKSATTDAATVTEWWARWPDAGIGWALPPGVVAADIDQPDGLEWAKARGGLPGGGALAETPSGGWHLPMALPDEGPWAQRDPAPSVNSRIGGHGYLVLPDGRPGRAWRRLGEIGDLVDPAKLPPAPDWFVEGIRADTAEDADPNAVRRGDDLGSVGIRRAVLKKELAGAPWLPNDRHQNLLRVGTHLRKLGAGAKELRASLDKLNEAVCRPPKSRGWTAERDRFAKWLVGLQPEVLDGQPVPEGGFPEPLDRSQAVPSPFHGVEYIEGLVRPERITLVAAEEGTGKTFAAIEAGVRVAVAGGSFAGTWPIHRQGPVVVLSEMHPDDVFDYETDVLASLGLAREALAGRYFGLSIAEAAGGAPPLLNKAWRAFAVDALRRRGAVMLIVDTITMAAPTDPWGEQLLELFSSLRAMSAACPGLAIVLLIHFKKPQGSGKAERPLSDVLGWFGRFADVVLLMSSASGKKVKLQTRKRIRERVIVAAKQGGLLVDPVEVDTSAPVIKARADEVLAAVASSPGITYEELAAHFTASEKTIKTRLKDLAEEGRIRVERPPTGAQRRAQVYPVPGTRETTGNERISRDSTGVESSTLETRNPPYRGSRVLSSSEHDAVRIDPAATWKAIDEAGGIRPGEPVDLPEEARRIFGDDLLEDPS